MNARRRKPHPWRFVTKFKRILLLSIRKTWRPSDQTSFEAREDF